MYVIIIAIYYIFVRYQVIVIVIVLLFYLWKCDSNSNLLLCIVIDPTMYVSVSYMRQHVANNFCVTFNLESYLLQNRTDFFS